jgi:hypothetical protein
MNNMDKINIIDTDNIKTDWCYDCNRKLACSGKGRGGRRAEQEKSIKRHYDSNLHQKNKKKTDKNVYNLLLAINRNVCGDLVGMINEKVVNNYRKITDGGNIDDCCIDTWDNDNKVNCSWCDYGEKYQRPYVMNMYGFRREDYSKDTSHANINQRIKQKTSPEFYKLDNMYYDIHNLDFDYCRKFNIGTQQSYHNINMEWKEISLINKTINRVLDMNALIKKVMTKYYEQFIYDNPDLDKNTPEEDDDLLDKLHLYMNTINFEIKNIDCDRRYLKNGEKWEKETEENKKQKK